MLSTIKAESNRNWLTDIIWLTLLLGVFYAIWIGSHALFTPDEGRYSEVAREMVASGDYITPRLNGVAFLDKPALYYWLQAIAIHVFGLKEWALRFWPATFGVLGCVMTYFAGRMLFNRRTGWFAAIILATSPLYYGAAHYANLDLEVSVLIGITLWFFLLALQPHYSDYRKIFLFCAYIFCGLAALTKGLIGLAFPAMIVGTWILLLNRWSSLKNLRLVTGAVIFIAITVPWYYLVQKANPQFLHFFFVTQQVSRFLTHGDYNNRTVFWFYVPIVLLGFFPWSVFIVQAITKNLKTVWQNRKEHSIELFLLLWFVIIFTFFSIPKSKTVGYILPIFPALALMVGHYLENLWNKPKTRGFYVGLYLFIFSSLLVTIASLAAPHISAWNLAPDTTPYLFVTAGLFLATSILVLTFFKKRDYTKILYSLTLFAVIGLLTLSKSLGVLNQNSIKPLILSFKAEVKPQDEVVTYYKYYQDLPLYLERRVSIVADWHADDIPTRDNWVRELWYGMPFQDTKDWLISADTFWERWNSNKRLFVLMNARYFNEFASKAAHSIRLIKKYNDVILVSNSA